MAAPTAPPPPSASEYGSDINVPSSALSDYGSDTAFDDFLEDAPLIDAPATKNTVLPSIEFEEGEREDEEQDVDAAVQIRGPTLLRIPKSPAGAGRQRGASLEVEYDEGSRRAWSVELVETPRPPSTRKPASPRTPRTLDVNDTRPPLARFRTKPKKPLSVTDLVSPAWCELQYLYTLTTYGRKPRTQAMRTGSKIHQKLEDEVHTTVPVQVQSAQDRFGLRIWNAISGLRCLRETGLTRELEVWGVLEGQVVNGVIDELSYECPDVALEEKVDHSEAEKNGITSSPDQPRISDMFAKVSASQDGQVWPSSAEPARRIYIADVKTRSVPSLPTGASLRPTWMQLMVYRKLLSSLSLNNVDAESIFARYNLLPLEPFTPVFMQEIGRIGPSDEAASFPNLLSLWSLLITEMQLTLPPTSLSPLLRAEFRYAKTAEVIGSEITVFETDIIDKYVAGTMAFWKGDRDAKGVEVEEAFKCRICDFAEGCTWRKNKVEEATEKSRLRQQTREKSAV